MSGRITALVDPFQLVERRAIIAGSYAVSSLPRVKAAVLCTEGEFAVRLEFHPDDAGHGVVTGHLTGTVILQCQRCLDAMAVALDISPRLGLCTSEAEADRLLDGREPVMVKGGTLNIREVVEDEILLALPIVARHTQPCGEFPGTDFPGTDQESQSDENTRQPFRNLRKMLDEGS